MIKYNAWKQPRQPLAERTPRKREPCLEIQTLISRPLYTPYSCCWHLGFQTLLLSSYCSERYRTLPFSVSPLFKCTLSGVKHTRGIRILVQTVTAVHLQNFFFFKKKKMFYLFLSVRVCAGERQRGEQKI